MARKQSSKPASRPQSRNSAIPPRPATPPRNSSVTHEQIAKRAYEIHASGKGGSQQENWFRAERELRTGSR